MAQSTHITLRDRRPGEVVTFADATPYGGTMLGRAFPAGAVAEIAWHAGDSTFVRVWSATERQWSSPTAVAASTPIGTVEKTKAPPTKVEQPKKGVDTDDPMQRRFAELGDAPLFDRARGDS